MTDINPLIIRDAVRFYGADGIEDSDPASLNYGTPDGYLSVAELRATIERVQTHFETWRQANQFTLAPILIYEKHEVMTRRVAALEDAIVKARAAEERGEPGMRYMADSFYDLVKKASLTGDAIRLAVASDSDLDGEITFKEADRFVWFVGQTLKNPDNYYAPEASKKLLDALRPPESEGKVTGVRLR